VTELQEIGCPAIYGVVLFRYARFSRLPVPAADMTGAELPDWGWWALPPQAAVRNLFAVPPGRAAVRVPLTLRQARSLHRDERLDEAVCTYRTAIEELCREEGDDAPMTLGARAGLANALFDVGDLRDAAREARDVVERAGHELPPDHAIILAADRVQARAMHGFGLYDHAESSLRDLLKACVGHLGPEHRLSLRVRGDLAALLADRDTARAAAEYTELIDTAVAALGPTDEDVLGLRLDAAILTIRRGQASTAIATLERLLAIQTGTLGGSHGQTVHARYRLAGVLLLVGRPGEAEMECRDVLRRWRERHGTAGPRALAAQDLLVRCLCARRAYRLAESECRGVLARRRELYGEHHPTTLATRLRLVSILRALGEQEEAGQHAGVIERLARQCLDRSCEHDDIDAARMPIELRRMPSLDYAGLLDRVRAIGATRPGPNEF